MTDLTSVHAEVEAPAELLQSSYVIAGLAELARQGGLASLRVVPRRHRAGSLEPDDDDAAFRQVEPLARKTVFVTLRRGATERTVAFELSDMTTRVPVDAVTDGLVVVRRSYRADDAALARDQLGVEARPLGLTFPVRSTAGPPLRRLLRGVLAPTLRPVLEPRSGIVRRGRWAARKLGDELRGQRGLPELPLLAERPRSVDDGYVLFQTRSFGAGDVALADERAVLIRALRNRLGSRFRGGFVPDPWIAARHPDCITSEATSGSDYLRLVAGATVVVYSNGVHESPAWKLAEYLGHGRAIVGLPLAVELAEPLVDGVHWRCAPDTAGVAEASAELLDDEAARRALEAAARAYYEGWVDPPVVLRRIVGSLLG